MGSKAEQPQAAIKDTVFVKEFADSTEIKSIPSFYAQANSADNVSTIKSEDTSIPVIDYALLISSNSDDRNNAIHQLGKACQDWGFFMLVNHGIEESLIKEMFEVSNEFFDLPQEEKKKYETKHVLDPITCGTSYNNALNDQVFFWRDFLKLFVHPVFHFPAKPESFRDLAREYSGKIRGIAMKLLGGISESLGLEEDYIEKTLNLDKGIQVFAVNYYPRCPRPEDVIGLPAHTDHGLVTLLVQNGVGGLEILHEGQWIQVNALPNSILVNTSDHLEIFSNGKYKSVMHRAVLNSTKTRITLPSAHGPSLDSIIRPAIPLLEKEKSVPAYNPVNYREYMEQQQLTRYGGKTILERTKIVQE